MRTASGDGEFREHAPCPSNDSGVQAGIPTARGAVMIFMIWGVWTVMTVSESRLTAPRAMVLEGPKGKHYRLP
jgi:hypothetical protein